MYDAKKLLLDCMNEHFKRALAGISDNLEQIGKMDEFIGEVMRESVDKITARVNDLPSGEATEMLEGLGQIMSILSGRINEVRILATFMKDPAFVSSEALAKIVQNPLLYESCNLPEELIPYVPPHLLPAEYHF